MTSLSVSANGTGSNGFSANGAHVEVPRESDSTAAIAEPSAYLQYLPAIYWQDPFIGRFLRVMEDIFAPLQRVVSTRTHQFDPSLASQSMLVALAGWVGADLAEQMPEARARQYIKNVITLHRLRGTKAGLRLALSLATGQRLYVQEFSPGLVLGRDAALGLNTALADGQPLQVHIVLNCRQESVDVPLVDAIIRRYKPANTSYTISYRE
jgi:phage tail-like protein